MANVPPAVRDGIEAASVSLDSTDPGADLADLAPLRGEFEDATVVGLGESTHGTREFFRLKHRLIRYLVEELGVRVVGWEANFAATVPIDEYVRHGRGDPADLLANESIHWPFRSEAVLHLVEWLREFNEGRDPDDRVGIHGFDMQYPADAAAGLAAFLAGADPDLLEDVREDLSELSDTGVAEMFVPDLRSVAVDRAERVAEALETPFEERGPAYADATGEDELRIAGQYRRTLAQWVAQRRGDDPLRARDEAMAENVEWILDFEDASRIVLWGHNAHLKRGPAAAGALGIEPPSMGEVLDAKYGERYLAVGFEFGRGAVRVHSMADNEFETREVDEPPAGSVPEVFGDAVDAPFVFLPDRVPAESVLSDWIDEDPARHLVVGSYEDDPVTYVESPLECFDALAFVPESSPSRPTDLVYPDLDHPGG